MSNTTANHYLTLLYPDQIARAIEALTEQYKPGRGFTGGVLAIITRGPNNFTSCSANIGQPGEKIHDFAYFAHEKIHRLHQRRQTRDGKKEFAASQSADETKQKYGGCIVGETKGGDNVYIAFSAAPAKVDEAIVYVLAEKFNLFVPSEYDNDLVPKARELLNGCVLSG